jgi:hypothetical protein
MYVLIVVFSESWLWMIKWIGIVVVVEVNRVFMRWGVEVVDCITLQDGAL